MNEFGEINNISNNKANVNNLSALLLFLFRQLFRHYLDKNLFLCECFWEIWRKLFCSRFDVARFFGYIADVIRQDVNYNSIKEWHLKTSLDFKVKLNDKTNESWKLKWIIFRWNLIRISGLFDSSNLVETNRGKKYHLWHLKNKIWLNRLDFKICLKVWRFWNFLLWQLKKVRFHFVFVKKEKKKYQVVSLKLLLFNQKRIPI